MHKDFFDPVVAVCWVSDLVIFAGYLWAEKAIDRSASETIVIKVP